MRDAYGQGRRWPTTRRANVACYGCGRRGTCTVSPDGTVCWCWRDGGGAIHRARDGQASVVQGAQAPAPKLTIGEVADLAATRQNAIVPAGVAAITGRTDAATTTAVEALASQLGVAPGALYRLGIGWDGSAWTFPMYDGSLRPVGLHRRFPDGRKVCVRGSTLGLFVPLGRTSLCSGTAGGDSDKSPPRAGIGGFVTTKPSPGGLVSPPPSAERLLICEGASDAAAALTLGYLAVGVPSAGQGGDLVVELADRVRPGTIVLVADLDEGSVGPQGKVTWPGLEGGLRLAERLMVRHPGVHFCLPPAGTKDLRQWLKGEADRAVIRQAIAAAPQVTPEWLNRARRNVDANRCGKRDPSWARRASSLLNAITDPTLRADLRERFEERAGIIEFDGNLPRDEAERLAYEELARLAREHAGKHTER